MTCPACTHPRVRLIDGTETCSWSEEWRAECEARAICDMPTLTQRREHMELIKRKRTEAGYVKLRTLVARLWNARRPAGGGG